ncbi:MAG: hypothetical protein HC819_16765 [Cyclobacteriaceae bacterium]|nr:hypothetical protein [Cyclobacteriaceae bacterium]
MKISTLNYRHFLFNGFCLLCFLLLFISCQKEDDEISIFQPLISEVIPSEGPINTEIIIVGKKFSVVPELNVVRCGRSNLNIIKVNPDTIWARITPGTETNLITVWIKDLKDVPPAESAVEFTVLGPNIEKFEPETGVQGDTISLFGSYFSPAAKDFELTLKGKSIGQVITKSDTLIKVILANKLNSGLVHLQTLFQEIDSKDSLIILPRIFSVNPKTVPEETEITVLGSNFNPAPKVMIANVEAEIVSSNDSIIKVIVPLILGSNELEKTTELSIIVDGYSSEAKQLTVVPSTSPVIFYIDPSLSKPGEQIQIFGKNFSSDNATPTINFTGRNKQLINAKINGSVSDALISVTVPDEAISGPIYLKIEEIEVQGGPLTIPIAITNLKPLNIWEGSVMTIVGSGFPDQLDNLLVNFQLNDRAGGGEIQLKPISVNADLTELRVRVPQGAKNRSLVTISFSENRFVNEELLLTIQKPVMESITPNVAENGSEVTIIGSSFPNNPSEINLYFPGPNAQKIKATIVSSKYSEIKAIVPQGVTEGNIILRALDGPEVIGPIFTFGKPPKPLPVIYFSSNFGAGVFKVSFVQGNNGLEGSLEKVMDVSAILDITYDNTSNSIYAMNQFEVWEKNLDNASSKAERLYAKKNVVNHLRSFTANNGNFFFTSFRNNFIGDKSNGTIFRVENNGLGTPELLFDKDNGFTLPTAAHYPKIEASIDNELFWGAQSQIDFLFGVINPFNIVRAKENSSQVEEIYSAEDLLKVAGFNIGSFSSNGWDLIMDLDVQGNDLFVCHGIPIDLGSNIALFPKVIKGKIDGSSTLEIVTNSFIDQKDRITAIACTDDYLYGIHSISTGGLYIFRMKKDGSDYQQLFDIPSKYFGSFMSIEVVE